MINLSEQFTIGGPEADTGVEELLDDDKWFRKFHAQFYFSDRSLQEAKVYSTK